MPEKRNWRKILPLAAILTVSLAVGITSATILHAVTLENPIKTPTVEGHVDEDVGSNGKKEVRFSNDGSADVFLRMSYAEGWTYDPDPAIDGDEIVLPNTALLADGSKKEAVAVPDWNLDSWIKRDDGWYYYKYPLKAGKNTGYVTTKVKFPSVKYEGTGENKKLVDYKFADARYADAQYSLTFTMEIVQASDDADVSVDAVKELFHLDLKDALPENWPTDKYGTAIDWTKAAVWTGADEEP